MRLSKWFGKVEPVEIKSGISNPEPWLVDLFGATPVSSGVSVNPHNAMQCTAVACAVKAIAETIGQLPLHVFARGADGSKERAPEHPVYSLVHDEVNDWTSAPEFREQMTADALLHEHGAFAVIVRVSDRPIELHRLRPETVTVETDEATGEPVYKVAEGNNRERRYSFRDILHLRGLGSPVKQAREAIGLAMVLDQYAARLFANDARPGSVITHPNKLSATEFGQILAAWKAAFGGKGSGKPAILDNGADHKQITLSSVDAQFMELRTFLIEEIARAFRVPPTLLMRLERATHHNAEEMGQQFLTYALMPWVERWQSEIRLKLFSADERRTFFAEFLTEGLLKIDFKARMEGYTKAIAARILNPNEARARENLPPYEGGDAFANPHITTAPAIQDQPNG